MQKFSQKEKEECLNCIFNLQIAQKRCIQTSRRRTYSIIDEPIYFINFSELCAYLKPGKIQVLASKFNDFLVSENKKDSECILSRYMIQPTYINFVLN